MFQRRYEKKIRDLERELLEAEEEYEDEYEEDPEESMDEDYPEDEDYDEEYDPDDEDYDQEEYYRNCGNSRRPAVTRYRRGSTKKFCDDDFFETELNDSEVYYKKDYKKAKRKKRRKTIGMIILALAEIAAFGAILLWWMSWMQ